LIARRRPVPLIIFAIGVVAAGLVAGALLAPRAGSRQDLGVASLETGFIAALGVVIIWQLTAGKTPGATRTAMRVGQMFIVRGLVFSLLAFLSALAFR
jgi:hypothetical protein